MKAPGFRGIRVGAIVLAVLAVAVAPAAPAQAQQPFVKKPTAVGYGGAVATVDADATAVGLEVLRRGGNAVDAAVAAAAALGVTEPFSAGIGGGGFFVFYDARSRRVSTIDGRETAPAAMTRDTFVDPATGAPYAFPEARGSAASRSACPGRWRPGRRRCERWGSRSLRRGAAAGGPARRRQGFTVDATFRQQVADNAAAFGQFDSTSALYLPGGAAARRRASCCATPTSPTPTA